MGARRRPARDPERTAAAVLDAAEALFAEKGYDAASLGEIGRKAGVSRGTPSYLFGSKEGLYQAVIERVVKDVKDLVGGIRSRATAGGAEKRRPEERLAGAVGAYMDFLAARPAFVKLIEREVLDAGRFSGMTPPGIASVSESLGGFGREILAEGLKRGPFREVDPGQLAISIVALCFFPFAHAGGLLKEIGLDPYDPTFLEARKRHVADLVLRGILAPTREGGEGL